MSRVAEASCSTFTITGVSFGTYNVFTAGATDSTGDIKYKCTAGQPISITLSKGAAPTFTPRTLLKGSETLDYNLFMDASRSVIWGDGTSPTSFYSDSNPPNGNVQVTIFARIPAGQDVTAGSYTDTVLATINF